MPFAPRAAHATNERFGSSFLQSILLSGFSRSSIPRGVATTSRGVILHGCSSFCAQYNHLSHSRKFLVDLLSAVNHLLTHLGSTCQLYIQNQSHSSVLAIMPWAMRISRVRKSMDRSHSQFSCRLPSSLGVIGLVPLLLPTLVWTITCNNDSSCAADAAYAAKVMRENALQE